MPIRPGTILLLLVMATAFHRTGLAGENKEQTSLIAGSAYSPTSYGGDRTGLRGAKGKFGIEVSVRKLRTGGASMNNFDAAPSELPGLDQYLLGAALVFCK